ncbi:MAG: hypothetical protein ABSH28_05220 [Acidobacteriota bacterium]
MRIPLTNYTRGRGREYRTMDMLRKLGYYPIRAAGSHGLFDVVAIGPEHVRLIQVKFNCKPTAEERRALESFATPENVVKELWVFKCRMQPEIYTL